MLRRSTRLASSALSDFQIISTNENLINLPTMDSESLCCKNKSIFSTCGEPIRPLVMTLLSVLHDVMERVI